MKASAELCINKLSDTDAKPELKWCVTRFFNPFKIQPDRITKQLEENAKCLNFDGTEFPVNLTYINEFEKENPEISVNVLGYENKNIFPLRISELLEREHEVNLLLLENKHCVLINDLSRLLSSQISGHDGKKPRKKCWTNIENIVINTTLLKLRCQKQTQFYNLKTINIA